MEMQRIIVDCDGGSDDAIALILLIEAHKKNKIQLLAITCVAGNTTIDNVVKNVFRTLEACDSPDIPVFAGAHTPLLSLKNSRKAQDLKYHGDDGFGDAFKDEPDVSKLKKGHAIVALHELTAIHPNGISIVCLGPLTNIALGVRVFPHILNDVKDFWIMGGNSTARGNITSHAEFNFYADPESVHMLLKSNTKPLWLLPWETCLHTELTHEWRENVLGKKNTKTMQLINAIEAGIYTKQMKRQFYNPCDAYLAAAILKPNIIKESVRYHVDIELTGSRTRGQVLLNHLKTSQPNVHLIEGLDVELFKDLLLSAFDPSHTPNIL